jgi:hypothetical protein
MRTFRQMMYRMKRDSGQPVAIYRVTQATPNFSTGAITPAARTKYDIKRAIVLPLRVNQKFEYDLGFVAANKNFTYGGLFQIGDREVIIDAADLPNDFMLDKENDYIVYDNRRFNIQYFDALDYRVGFYLHLRQTQNQAPHETIEYPFVEWLVPDEMFVGEL